MSFVSLQFLLFLAIVLPLHALLPHRARWVLLLIASYYFYMSWNAALAGLIITTTLVSYGAALLMPRCKRGGKRALFVLTLVVCLGILVFFKYFNFFANSVVDFINLFGMELSGPSLTILLPIGISFYTFQTLSYVIDVYRGKIAPEKHLGYYALFVSFFPQLVAGPIERPENLLPQLKAERRLCGEDMREGGKWLISGFLRKAVIADSLAALVDAVYSSPAAASGPAVALATALFAVQIYCDFAGYSEIAMGCARLMGVKLMKNFDRPYSATSLRGFWRRWHISLTGWFTDYLYIPLGGSRKGKARRCLNTLFVFLISGLWHGANFTFVVWGGLHGLYVAGEALLAPHLQRLKQRLKLKDRSRLRGTLQRIAVFILVGFSWIFFRAQTLTDAFTLIVKLFSAWDGAAFSALLHGIAQNGEFFAAAALALALLPALPLLTEPQTSAPQADAAAVAATTQATAAQTTVKTDSQSIRERAPLSDVPTAKIPTDFVWRCRRMATAVIAVFAAALSVLSLLSQNQSSAFIYFQF